MFLLDIDGSYFLHVAINDHEKIGYFDQRVPAGGKTV